MKELEYLHSKFNSGVKKVVLEYKGADWWREFCKIFGRNLIWNPGFLIEDRFPIRSVGYIYIYNNFRITESDNKLNSSNRKLLDNGELIFATLDEIKAGITIDIDEWLKLMG